MKETDIMIREATITDLSTLHALLVQAGLSTDDVLADGTRYWLTEDTLEYPIGVIGLELGQDAVLLRSAAIRPSHRGQGIGTLLVQHALNEATIAGYQYVYLFSTDAGTYWQRLGFREVPVSELVTALPDAPQVPQYQRLGWLATEVAWRHDLQALSKSTP